MNLSLPYTLPEVVTMELCDICGVREWRVGLIRPQGLMHCCDACARQSGLPVKTPTEFANTVIEQITRWRESLTESQSPDMAATADLLIDLTNAIPAHDSQAIRNTCDGLTSCAWSKEAALYTFLCSTLARDLGDLETESSIWKVLSRRESDPREPWRGDRS